MSETRSRATTPLMTSREDKGRESARVGRIGQTAVKAWCDEADLLANAPAEDLGGWDYIVQILASPKSPDALRHICMVQVKTTRDATSAHVSLSNCFRMMTPTPAFIVFVKLGGDNRPKDAFVMPFTSDRAARAIAKWGELTAEQRERAGKHQVSFIPLDHERISLKGESLRSALVTHIGDDIDNYSTEKSNWVRELRDRHTSATLLLTGRPDDVWPKIADLLVGDTTSLKVDGLELANVEYGVIGDVKHLREAGEVQVQSLRPQAQKRVRVYNESRSVDISAECSVYSTAAAANVPEEYERIRFKSPVLRAETSRTSDTTVKLTFAPCLPPDRDPVLSELWDSSRICEMLSNHAEDPVWIDIAGLLKRRLENVRCPNANGELVHALAVVLRHFGLPDDTIVPVGVFDEVELVGLMRAAITKSRTGDISFTMTTPPANQPSGRFAMWAPLKLAGRVVIMGIGLVGEIRRRGTRVTFKNPEVRELRRFNLPDEDAALIDWDEELRECGRMLAR
jgi:hypothetical protein